MNQRRQNFWPSGREKYFQFVLAFFPVVASSSNLSTSIRLQRYGYESKIANYFTFHSKSVSGCGVYFLLHTTDKRGFDYTWKNFRAKYEYPFPFFFLPRTPTYFASCPVYPISLQSVQWFHPAEQHNLPAHWHSFSRAPNSKVHHRSSTKHFLSTVCGVSRCAIAVKHGQSFFCNNPYMYYSVKIWGKDNAFSVKILPEIRIIN